MAGLVESGNRFNLLLRVYNQPENSVVFSGALQKEVLRVNRNEATRIRLSDDLNVPSNVSQNVSSTISYHPTGLRSYTTILDI